MQDARDRYAREDAAARVLQRTFGKNAMHIKFLRSAVAELTFERAVLGELCILIHPSPFFFLPETKAMAFRFLTNLDLFGCPKSIWPWPSKQFDFFNF